MSDNQHRNRDEGWKHAKISGHENEDAVYDEILENVELKNRILHAAHKENRKIVSIDVGGLNEKDVPSVMGDKTKSKSDIKVNLDNGETIGISVKKSLSGQVYLIGIDRFIQGYEKQFGEQIPDEVKFGIRLYWGSDSKTDEVIKEFSAKNKKYELHKHRIVAETLKKYSSKVYDDLINWFSSNIINLFDFCFSRGLAASKDDWATLIWYKNDIGEVEIDALINIDDAKKCMENKAFYGTRTGGSTIQLPFGFVQWHSPKKVIPGEIQFHHKYNEINNLLKDYCEENGIDFDINNPTEHIK